MQNRATANTVNMSNPSYADGQRPELDVSGLVDRDLTRWEEGSGISHDELGDLVMIGRGLYVTYKTFDVENKSHMSAMSHCWKENGSVTVRCRQDEQEGNGFQERLQGGCSARK